MAKTSVAQDNDLSAARELIASGMDLQAHLDFRRRTEGWDDERSKKFAEAYAVAQNEKRSKDIIDSAVGVFSETLSPDRHIHMRRLEGQWTEEDEQKFSQVYNAVKALPEKQMAKLRKAAEDQATIDVLQSDLKQYPPIFRDVLMGVKQATFDLGSLAARPFSGKTADELNRETQLLEQAAAGADAAAQTGAFGGYVRGASRSVATSAALSPLGGYGIIGGFALSRGNQAITEATDAGLSGRDKWGFVGRSALIEGGIAAAFQAVGAGGMEKLLGGGASLTKSGLKAMLKRTGIALLQELPEENITEILDQYNQIASGVDPQELTWDRALDIMKDTTIQTALAVGATGTYQGITAQKALKEREALARQLSESFSLDEKTTLGAIDKAAAESKKTGRKFDIALGRELESAVIQTPEGAAAWADQNVDEAAALADAGESSRKAFADVGLPKMSAENRSALLERVTAVVNEKRQERDTAIEEDVGVDEALESPEAIQTQLDAEAQAKAELKAKEQRKSQDVLVEQFDVLVSESLDLEAGIKEARDAGDLKTARKLNKDLSKLRATAQRRFSGLDLEEIAKPVDPAVLKIPIRKPKKAKAVVAEKPAKIEAAEKVAPKVAAKPEYTRQSLSVMKKPRLVKIAKELGIENVGDMNRKMLVASILKPRAQKKAEAPAAVKKPVEQKKAIEEPAAPEAAAQPAGVEVETKAEEKKAPAKAEPAAKKPAVTTAQEKKLTDLGYSKSDIGGMDAKLAADTVRVGLSKSDLGIATDKVLSDDYKPLKDAITASEEETKTKTKVKPEVAAGGATGDAFAATGGPDAFAGQRVSEAEADKPPVPSEAVKREASKLTTNEMADGLLGIVAPAVRGESAQKTSKIQRMTLAQASQRDEAVRHQLNEYSKLFRWMNDAEVIEFVDLMETGGKQKTPELQKAADAFRVALDNARALVQEHGKLSEYYENYFPHLFEDPNKARGVITKLLGSRQLKPASFLKKRKYLTLKEGTDAGLKLAHYNPVNIVMLRIHEMNRYVAGADYFQLLKSQNLARFVPENIEKSYLPAGYEFIDDPAFKVVSNPEVSVEEAYDKLLADQLLGIASSMGVSHQRLAKLGGRRWGLSGPGKNIITKFAGPLSVLAHEIGHQIGDNYGLYEYIRTGPHTKGRPNKTGISTPNKADAQRKRGVIDKEFRALADLRHEGVEATKGRVSYERKRAEKEAVLMEVWLAAPDKMAKIAPNITEAWKAFLEKNDVLKPLLTLDRSVVLTTGATDIKLPGVLTLGKWAVPAESATIINNYLKPGLRNHHNAFIRSTYQGIRFIGNAMNQASLSLSAFHALNVASDAISSQIGLGLQKLFRGQIGGALKEFLSAPFAAATDIRKGHELMKAMRTDLNDIADDRLKAMVEAIMQAGGRASMDTIYHNHAIEGLFKTLRDLKTGEGSALAVTKVPFQMAFSALEVLAKPIMEFQVPRLKLGVFYKLSRDVFSEAQRKGWSDDRIQTELARAWDSVDNRMGQLVYDNLGWSRWMKDMAMQIVRSVGWNLGSIREFGGAIGDAMTTPLRAIKGDDLITRRMGYALGSTVSYATQASILTYLFTGKWPWEEEDESLKDYFFPRTGRKNKDGSDERLSLPHYSKDWVAWYTRAAKTAKHKLHPLWGTMADIIENKDYFGTKVRNEDDPISQQFFDVARHIGEAFTPFSVRNYFRMREAGEDKALSAAIAASGISPAPAYLTRTPAKKLMSQMIQDRIPSGARTKEQAKRSVERKEAIRNLRSGKKVDLSGFTSKQIKSIEREAKVTAFQASFSRLGFADALNVFNVATTDERKQTFDILAEKKSRAKDLTEERLQMYYSLKVDSAALETRRKIDAKQAGRLLMTLSSGQRKGESDTAYKARTDEIISSLESNPEFDSEAQQVRALMREAAKARGFKHTRVYKPGGGYTPFGARTYRVLKQLDLLSAPENN